MEYIQSLEGQILLFLRTCGLGFFLGMLYEVFRVIRLAVGKKFVDCLTDVIYMLLSAVLFFIFLLSFGNGGFRINTITALLVGWLTYIVTFGRVVYRFNERLLRVVKKVVAGVIKVISWPFTAVFSLMKKLTEKIRHCFAKKSKKVSKMLKFHLKFRT